MNNTTQNIVQENLVDRISAKVAENPTRAIYWVAMYLGLTNNLVAYATLGENGELSTKGFRIGQRLSALYNPEA